MGKNKECDHIFRMFKDPDIYYINKSESVAQVSFYCQKCLKLVKKPRVYENGQ